MPPVAIVHGCADCPLCAVVVESFGYERTQAICQHQDGKKSGEAREVAKLDRPAPKKPPRWCPLRSAHYLVQLHSSVVLKRAAGVSNG